MKKTPYIFFLIVVWFHAQAQKQISLKEAVDAALKNNYGISMARNNAGISRINNSFGMAGGLPFINLSIDNNTGSNNVLQKYPSGSDVSISNALNNKAEAGITAGITLFNGFKVSAARDRLESLEKMNDAELNATLQNTMAAVMLKYYDIIRQQSYLNILGKSSELSQQKLEIVEKRGQVGMANDADKLQAQIDLNDSRQSVAQQEAIIRQAKAELSELMSTGDFATFNISDTILPDTTLVLDNILKGLDNNPSYSGSDYMAQAYQSLLKETGASRYPSLKLNAGYAFSLIQNDKASPDYNRNYGPYAGFGLDVPLFNGFIYRKQYQVAELNRDNALLTKNSLRNSLTSDVYKAYESYLYAIQQLGQQKQNLELASALTELVLKKFSLSHATIIDVKNAQVSFERAGFQLINLQYAAKAAEIELKRLSFTLVY